MLKKILSFSFVLVFLFTGCGEDTSLSFEETVNSIIESNAPSVVSTSPVDTATDVDLNSLISVTFDKAVNTATFDMNVSGNISGAINGGITFDGSDFTATFTPTGGLNYSEVYTVTFSAEDSAGNNLTQSFTFTTAISTAFNTDTLAKVTYNSGYFETGNGVVTDSTGNIYVTGSIYNPSSAMIDMAIWKYKSNGQPDTTFGLNGIVMHSGAAGAAYGNDYGKDIVLDTAGNIYVTGYSDNGSNNDMVIWKYSGDGSLDMTFNPTYGYVVYDRMYGDDYGNSITIDGNNTIYVAGSIYNQNIDYNTSSSYNTNDMAVWKYSPTGALLSLIKYDTPSYDGLTHHNEKASSIAVDVSGNMYVAGNDTDQYSSVKMRLWKYNSNNTLYNTIASATANSSGNSIALDSANNIYITGASAYDMAIWKYDEWTAINYAISYDAGNGDVGNSIVVDNNNNLYVTGSTFDGADMRIWRYNTNGTLDTSFDGDGMAIDFGGGVGNSITLDSNGIVVAGSSYNGIDNDMDIWRYNIDPYALTHNGTTYSTVASPNTGKIWLDRNLGASQACISSTDAACYGDYYQWGRNYDGHEQSSSATSSTQAFDVNTAGSNFITDGGANLYDWAYSVDYNGSQRTANWSKTDGTSVCPAGYKIPTYSELNAETTDMSFLNLPLSGYREASSGTLSYPGAFGNVWTSDVTGTNAYSYSMGAGAMVSTTYRAFGFSVRCIKQ